MKVKVLLESTKSRVRKPGGLSWVGGKCFGGKRENMSGAQDLFKTSMEASVAVNLAEGWGGRVQKSEGAAEVLQGTRFWESESDLIR